MNIKAIFFDYDGVLTTDKTGTLTTYSYLSQKTGIDYARISTAFRRYNPDLLVGKITHKQIWKEICLELKTSISFDMLEKAFQSTPIDEDMFSLAKKIKEKYTVGIITDNKQDRMAYLIEYQNLNNIFNPIVVSAEIGCNKTNHKIFSYALDCVKFIPDECLFIDNQQKNLDVPKKMGFNTILFEHELMDASNLEKMLHSEMDLQF